MPSTRVNPIRATFEIEERAKVKTTELVYRWLKYKGPDVGTLPKPSREIKSETVNVVVYDIVEFSKLDRNALRRILDSLRSAVDDALRMVNVDDPREAKDFWYAPAGDGGVIAFRKGLSAWLFAKGLKSQCSVWNVPIRIGITTGSVVVFENVPVGRGIIEADDLSALPDTGEICASAHFWNGIYKSDKDGWSGELIAENPSALLLRLDDQRSKDDPLPQEEPEYKSRDEVAAGTRARCQVVLSEANRSAGFKLETVAEDAVENLERTEGLHFEPIETVYATDATASPYNFAQITRNLCRFEVVIFDITNYEPSIMLLIGIRAVVRRGVSILSMGGSDLLLDAIRDLPFNIKDANLVSHSKEHQRDKDKEPWRRLAHRISHGMRQMDSLEYLDLPAYDAVRNLPVGERSTIPADECVLALVSFGRRYVERNWQTMLRPHLVARQDLIQPKGRRTAPQGIIRSVDIDSPRLVSHAIYGFIRRTALCIADWTDLRPNVFFELGVRLAASQERTVCLIDKSHHQMCDEVAKDPQQAARWVGETGLATFGDEPNLAESVRRIQAIARQCLNLMRLFNCFEYDPDDTPAKAFAWIFDAKSSPQSESQAVAKCREAIAESFDTDAEPVAPPVHRELLRSAQRFTSSQSEAVSSVLFKNPRSFQLASNAARDRMLAAWKALFSWHSDNEILQDEVLRGEAASIIEYLSRDQQVKNSAMVSELMEFQKKINQARRQERKK